jgi:hypothetical protein
MLNLAIPNQNITVSDNATNAELQRAIEAAVSAATVQTKDIAKQFKGSSELEISKNIFNFLKNKITYQVDGNNQKIQLPSALLRDKKADCKSYSLFTSGVLSNLGIPYNLTYASYTPGNKEPEHVYVTTKSGIIIDAVWGKFNSEKKPIYKYQKPMKISYISGIKRRKYKGIGQTNLDWAKAVGLNLTLAQKIEIERDQRNPIYVTGREILLQLIKKNAGGIADFLYSISPFNGKGKENAELLAKWNAGLAQGESEIAKQYPIDSNWLVNYKSRAVVPSTSGGVILPGSNATGGYQAKTPLDFQNIKRLEIRGKLRDQLVKNLNKLYPYLVYPASTQDQQTKYRQIEIDFLMKGGNPNNFNDAVKEGITKSPRGTDFNYLLGKFQSKTYKTKDLGLAIRAVVAALTGGKRFGLGDPGIFTPWGGFKPGKISGIRKPKRIGAEPVTTTATVSASTAYWVTAITGIITTLGGAFINARWGGQNGGTDFNFLNDQNPDGWDPPAGNDNENGAVSENTWIVPVGLAAASYFLFKDKLK